MLEFLGLGPAVLGPGRAQAIYQNSSFLDRIMINPRLYDTFDQQLSTGIEGIDAVLRPVLWFTDQWYAPWLGVVCYLLVVAAMTRMRFSKRVGRPLATLTFVHNSVVALESAAILYLFSRELLSYLASHGYSYWALYCDAPHSLDGESSFRLTESLFYLNKWHELFDTVLLLLRGRQVTTLQLFHHTIMLLVTYYNRWPYLVPGMWLSVWLNLVVHVFMYSYFAASSIGVRLTQARIWLTSGQIIQFWLILLHALPWPFVRHYYGCLGHWSSWLWVVAPVTFINLLFLKFWFSQYGSAASSKTNGKKKKKKKKKQQKNKQQ